MILAVLLGGVSANIYYNDGSIINFYGFIVIWTATSMLVLKIQNKYYPSHFVPCLIPSSILWGMTLDMALERMASVHSWCSVDSALTCFIMAVLAAPMAGVLWAFRRYLFASTRSDYFLSTYLKRNNPHILQLIGAPFVGEYVRKRTDPKERVFALGYASTVYIYSRRRTALEFLESSLGIDPEIADAVWGGRWKWWVCRDIHKYKPKYIIDMDGRLNIGAVKRSTGLVYRREKTFWGCFDVFVLSSDQYWEPRFGGTDGVSDLVASTSERFEKRLEYSRNLFGGNSHGLRGLPEDLKHLMASWKKSVNSPGGHGPTTAQPKSD
jgi:hypothetical protein